MFPDRENSHSGAPLAAREIGNSVADVNGISRNVIESRRIKPYRKFKYQNVNLLDRGRAVMEILEDMLGMDSQLQPVLPSETVSSENSCGKQRADHPENAIF